MTSDAKTALAFTCLRGLPQCINIYHTHVMYLVCMNLAISL